MSRVRHIYISSLKSGKNTFIFYDDEKEFKIIGEVEWNANGKLIQKITFTGQYLNGRFYYKIIGVNPCKKSNLGYPFHIMHLLLKTTKPTNNTFVAENGKHLSNVIFNKAGDSSIFLFNIHEETSDGNNHQLGCTFNPEQPETKDGAIIVGI